MLILIMNSIRILQAGADECRVLHFPQDRSMGRLFILNANDVDNVNAAWKMLGIANGDVDIPGGMAVKLELSKEVGTDLSWMRDFRPNDLAVVSAGSTDITDEQLGRISHLTGLRHIDLGETDILGTGLRHLSRLQALRRLSLANTHVGDRELGHLVGLSGLRSLGLRGTPTGDAGMVHVGKITSLEVLALNEGISDKGFAHLKDLKNLRWLSTGGPDITDAGLAHLAALNQIEYLSLRGAQMTDAGLIHFRNMGKLKTLVLYGTPVTDTEMVHLANLQSLRELSVGAIITRDGKVTCSLGVTDEGLKQIAKLKKLERLTLQGATVTDEGLQYLAELPELRWLYLPGCGVTEQGVQRLQRKLPGLHWVR